MDFVSWLKVSPFAAPWFDVLLAGILCFEILPFFFRARAARLGFSAASLLCQVGMLVSCLFLGTTLTETLLVLALFAVFSAVSAYVEYRLFDRDQTVAACEIKAEEAKKIALERAERFVLPQSDKEPAAESKEGGDEA